MPGKKILFFCGGAYISGMEVVTLHLMQGLKEKGYEVRCVFSGWNDGNFKKKLDEIGVVNYEIKIGWIYIRKLWWTIDTLVHYPKAYFACRKIIRDFDPDICQFCNFSMSIMLRNLIGPKSVYNLQETHHANLKNKFIFRLLNKKISIFTAVSNHIVKVLKDLEIPGEKIELVYNGIPPVASGNHTTSLSPKAVLNFAIIGQVAPWKGHLILVEAVEKLKQRGISNFKVLVYGNDATDFGAALKKVIQANAAEMHFEWKGFVNNQEDVYADCDIVIVPSLSGEPCSLTIIESMSRGKAVIVSNRGGNPELVQDKINGMVFNATDPSQLADCMAYMISNREQIDVFGKSAKEKAAVEYTYLNMTQRYINLYEDLKRKNNGMPA
ncbi:MAG: glycosyltransferase family 4 protein [Chitinophagaceae bacterium]|nr:glycosyltransferase family 4 protein [Chitinophagaceae bacterium]